MTVTLKPVLDSLGYSTPEQQRAVVKLLQASGAFGKIQETEAMLNDKQADAILNYVTFNDTTQAANILHQITQEKMIKRAPGELPKYEKHRDELMDAVRQTGMLAEKLPTKKYYDHVLVLGATEAEVNKRLDTLKQMHDQGVRFGKIYMLGSERQLKAEREPSAGKTGAAGTVMQSEMGMMETQYYAKSATWPKELQDVRIFEVDTFNKEGGERANTQDTIKAWEKAYGAPGEVLVLSSQPYVKYQDASVKSVLPPSYKIETVGVGAERDVKVSTAMDLIARQIDVIFPKLLERLKINKPKLETNLVMLDPKNILVDAPTYQFRSGGDKNGVTAKGKHHGDHWDPILNGDPIMVHERLDGSVFVADGHHRVDLAKRLNENGNGPGKVAAMVLREADGYTAKDVKIIAAYKNIAHGKTDPVDTARVFKEAHSGQVDLAKLPHLQMDKGNLRMSFTLSKLSDKALDSVARGEVPPHIAAKLAERIPTDHKQQEDVLRIISEKLKAQSYTMTESTSSTLAPTMVQVNVFNMAKDTDMKAIPTFVQKLAMQRAQPISPTLSA